MKPLHSLILAGVILVAGTFGASATLVVQMSAPKTIGVKTIIKLDLKNTFTENIESARAAVFLLDNQGKMVGQKVQWVIGGTKSKPGLLAGNKKEFNFVITSDKPLNPLNVQARLTFTRLILQGGNLADPKSDVQIQAAP
jgi:hypothetical protein